jgi:hypothetical protein
VTRWIRVGVPGDIGLRYNRGKSQTVRTVLSLLPRRSRKNVGLRYTAQSCAADNPRQRTFCCSRSRCRVITKMKGDLDGAVRSGFSPTHRSRYHLATFSRHTMAEREGGSISASAKAVGAQNRVSQIRHRRLAAGSGRLGQAERDCAAMTVRRHRPVYPSDIHRLGGTVSVAAVRSRAADGEDFFRVRHISGGGDLDWLSPPLSDVNHADAAAVVLAAFTGATVNK